MTGFMLRLAKGKDSVWWENGGSSSSRPYLDLNPERTQMVADAYGKIILNTEYELKNPSKSYRKFMEAGIKLELYHKKHSMPVNMESLAEYLMRAVRKQFDEKGAVIQPGHLVSDNLWDIVLPQYLAEIFPE
jgi:hypothetical protein